MNIEVRTVKKYYPLLFGLSCAIFLSGCSGFSRLPKIDFMGKSREEVIRIFAGNPKKAWGTHINILTAQRDAPPYHCGNNRFFETVEEALADEGLKKSPALGGYMTERFGAVPAGWDYYEVVFDKNGIVVSQRISTFFDGP